MTAPTVEHNATVHRMKSGWLLYAVHCRCGLFRRVMGSQQDAEQFAAEHNSGGHVEAVTSRG